MKTTTSKHPSTKPFKISYSILVNGEEYPKEIKVLAADSLDAENKLRSTIIGNTEIVIIEVTPL